MKLNYINIGHCKYKWIYTMRYYDYNAFTITSAMPLIDQDKLSLIMTFNELLKMKLYFSVL